MLVYLVMMGSSAVLPLYAQAVDGLSSSQAGLVVLPGALCMAVVAPFAGRWFDRFGMRPLLVVGGARVPITDRFPHGALYDLFNTKPEEIAEKKRAEYFARKAALAEKNADLGIPAGEPGA